MSIVTNENIAYHRIITEKDLQPFLGRFNKIGAVIVITGYEKWLMENKPHILEYLPYTDESAAELLARFINIKVIGIDSLSVDKPGENRSHRILKDKMLIESLVNLSNIPINARNHFTLQALRWQLLVQPADRLLPMHFYKLTRQLNDGAV